MDIKLQEKFREFVNREVYVCQSFLVDELLNKGIFQYEDIENAFTSFGENGTEKGECQYCDENTEIDIDSLFCEDCFESEPIDIFEWWIVSDWLLTKLEEEGEPILKTDYQDYWGRTTTGQVIYMDGVIKKIIQKLEGKN